MFAGLRLQTCGHLGMTQPALPLKICRVRNRSQWLMRVGVAVQALLDRFSITVRSGVTACALGHQLRVVRFRGIVGVKLIMTISTEHLGMACAVGFYASVMQEMAPGTFLGRQGLDIDILIDTALGRFSI